MTLRFTALMPVVAPAAQPVDFTCQRHLCTRRRDTARRQIRDALELCVAADRSAVQEKMTPFWLGSSDVFGSDDGVFSSAVIGQFPDETAAERFVDPSAISNICIMTSSVNSGSWRTSEVI